MMNKPPPSSNKQKPASTQECSLLAGRFGVLGEQQHVAPVPVGQQLLPLEGEAGPPLVGLVQVHALVPRHDELGVLGWVGEGGAAQGTAVRVQLQPGVLLDGQSVTLGGRGVRRSGGNRVRVQQYTRYCGDGLKCLI